MKSEKQRESPVATGPKVVMPIWHWKDMTDYLTLCLRENRATKMTSEVVCVCV